MITLEGRLEEDKRDYQVNLVGSSPMFIVITMVRSGKEGKLVEYSEGD